jgi:hypothetical protein
MDCLTRSDSHEKTIAWRNPTKLEKIAALRELPGRLGPLSRLSGTGSDAPFGSRVRITRFLKPVVEAVQEYEKDFNTLVIKHGKENPQTPNTFVIPPENQKAYTDDLKSLHETEIEIAVIALDVKTVESTSLTPNDIIILEQAGLLVLPSDA